MYAAKQTENKKYTATVGQPCLAFDLKAEEPSIIIFIMTPNLSEFREVERRNQPTK